MTAKKGQCNCRGMVCHMDPDEEVAYVHFFSRVGGKGVHAYLSAECQYRRRGTFTIMPT